MFWRRYWVWRKRGRTGRVEMADRDGCLILLPSFLTVLLKKERRQRKMSMAVVEQRQASCWSEHSNPLGSPRAMCFSSCLFYSNILQDISVVRFSSSSILCSRSYRRHNTVKCAVERLLCRDRSGTAAARTALRGRKLESCRSEGTSVSARE